MPIKNRAIENMRPPESLEDAFAFVAEVFATDRHKIEDFKDEEDFISKLHHGLGRWIRNQWGLWKKEGALYDELCDLGLHHPDDMSSVILRCFWRQYHDEPLQLEALVQHYKDYWRIARLGSL